jgi:hypothetical protein
MRLQAEIHAPRRRAAALVALTAAAAFVALAALLVLSAAAWMRLPPPHPGIGSLKLSADGTLLLGVPRRAPLVAVRRRLIDAFAAAMAAEEKEELEGATGGRNRRLLQRGRGGNIRNAARPGVLTTISPVSLRRVSGVRRRRTCAAHHWGRALPQYYLPSSIGAFQYWRIALLP